MIWGDISPGIFTGLFLLLFANGCNLQNHGIFWRCFFFIYLFSNYQEAAQGELGSEYPFFPNLSTDLF